MAGIARSFAAVLCVAAAGGLPGCGDDGPAPAETAAKPATKPGAPADERADAQMNDLGRRELPRIRRMLDRLVMGVNGHDASICTEVYAPAFREELMRKRGRAALDACHDAVRRAKVQVAIVRVERAHLKLASDGAPRGSVQVVERIGTNTLLRVTFGVVRTPAGYRILSASNQEAPRDGAS